MTPDAIHAYALGVAADSLPAEPPPVPKYYRMAACNTAASLAQQVRHADERAERFRTAMECANARMLKQERRTQVWRCLAVMTWLVVAVYAAGRLFGWLK